MCCKNSPCHVWIKLSLRKCIRWVLHKLLMDEYSTYLKFASPIQTVLSSAEGCILSCCFCAPVPSTGFILTPSVLLEASIPKTCQLWSPVGVRAYSLGMLHGIRFSRFPWQLLAEVSGLCTTGRCHRLAWSTPDWQKQIFISVWVMLSAVLGFNQLESATGAKWDDWKTVLNSLTMTVLFVQMRCEKVDLRTNPVWNYHSRSLSMDL